MYGFCSRVDFFNSWLKNCTLYFYKVLSLHRVSLIRCYRKWLALKNSTILDDSLLRVVTLDPICGTEGGGVGFQAVRAWSGLYSATMVRFHAATDFGDLAAGIAAC